MVKTAKKLLLWSAIVTGIFLAQSLVSASLLTVNLTLLLVYYFGLKKGELAGVSVGISVGLLEDTLSGQLIGPGMLGKGLVGILSSYITDGFFIWTPLLGMLAVFVLTIVDEAVIYTSLTIFFEAPAPLKDFVGIALVKALINAPFGWMIRPENE